MARAGFAVFFRRGGRGAVSRRGARRAVFWSIVVPLCFFGAWFAFFLRPVPDAELGPGAEPADGIVVLTGGEGRVEAGLALLRGGGVRSLLISGVFDSVSDERFLRIWPEAAPWFSCCIVLGREARDTRGNAQEVAAWLAARGGSGAERLILVTSDFHMKRALLEHRRRLPEASFVGFGVRDDRMRPRAWLDNPRAGLESFIESLKYLLTLCGLSRFAPLRFGPA